MDKFYYLDFSGRELSLGEYLMTVERDIVLGMLNKHRGNRTRAAKEMKITLRSMRYRLHVLGIENNGAGRRVTPKGFSKVWPKLRESAFSIHGYACKQCGAMAKHGAKLHVDHIKPIRHYPELALDLSNLQVLCAKCNVSKGAK